MVKTISGLEAREEFSLRSLAGQVPPFEGCDLNDRGMLGQTDSGVTIAELLGRLVILSAVQDQGGEIIGVRMFVARSIRRMYEAGIPILHDPGVFFDQIETVVEILVRTHEEVIAERYLVTLIPGYTLFDQSTPIASIMLRWGTPLAVMAKIISDGTTVLKWIKSWRGAGAMVRGSPRLRMDRMYGLGKAIGHKASWLVMKSLIHSFPILRNDDDPRWGPNSYQIPLDQNVGRGLMRSGIIFAFVKEDRFVRTCCTKQKDGRYNLAANRLRNLKVNGRHAVYGRALQARKLSTPRASTIPFPYIINGLAEMAETTIGAIDDGLLTIGTTYCLNRPEVMKREDCPIRDLCFADNDAPRYYEQFYCGTGAGIFF